MKNTSSYNVSIKQLFKAHSSALTRFTGNAGEKLDSFMESGIKMAAAIQGRMQPSLAYAYAPTKGSQLSAQDVIHISYDYTEPSKPLTSRIGAFIKKTLG